MAITVTNISKQKEGIYTITIQDSLDADRSYTFKYNMADAVKVLGDKIKAVIFKRKTDVSNVSDVETKIKTLVEAIDTTIITVKD